MTDCIFESPYLELLSLDLHRFLPEIHPDGGLCFLWEAAAGEAET